MNTPGVVRVAPGQISCPFLRPVEANCKYPVQGICRGLPNALPMIPSMEEYRMNCSTAEYAACPIYRSRMGEDGLQACLQADYQRWALRPLREFA